MAYLSARLGSVVWRFLTFYGRIKYRYLLPVYRLFGAPSRSVSGEKNESPTHRIASRLAQQSNNAATRQIDSLLERVRLARGAIIFLPTSGWNIVNTQRSKHLAREFARQGYVSIYDSTSTYDDVNGIREVETNVFLFRGERSLLKRIPNQIVWALTPNFNLCDEIGSNKRIVYDWIDDLQVFPFEREFLERNHNRALKEAAAVFCSARRLLDEARRARPDAHYLPNGVDFGHFAVRASEPPNDWRLRRLLKEGKPIAGYHGALAEWFDYDLVEEVAGLRLDWNFLLVGPRYDSSLQEHGKRMLRRSNISWIGPRSYDVLPGYLNFFDVAMIPFLINDITLATSPLKLFEYLAGGKPVVATELPECKAIKEVIIARTASEFASALEDARSQSRDAQWRERARSIAERNSWASRVRSAIELIEPTVRDDANPAQPASPEISPGVSPRGC